MSPGFNPYRCDGRAFALALRAIDTRNSGARQCKPALSGGQGFVAVRAAM
jgi:hypothetical protein